MNQTFSGIVAQNIYRRISNQLGVIIADRRIGICRIFFGRSVSSSREITEVPPIGGGIITVVNKSSIQTSTGNGRREN